MEQTIIIEETIAAEIKVYLFPSVCIRYVLILVKKLKRVKINGYKHEIISKSSYKIKISFETIDKEAIYNIFPELKGDFDIPPSLLYGQALEFISHDLPEENGISYLLWLQYCDDAVSPTKC